MSFSHLHVHSHYSFLDGMSKLPALISKAIELGMPGLALTDHGSMYGIQEFWYTCEDKNKSIKKERDKINQIIADLKEKGEMAEIANLEAKLSKLNTIKPILGCEVYIAPNSRFDKSAKDEGKMYYHLILLAKNKQGYRNLCKLCSLAWIEGYYYKPRIDKEILKKYSEGLIVTSACLGGEIPQAIMRNNIEEAENAIMWFKEVFGDDFYLEIQRHQTNKINGNTSVYQEQCVVNKIILELGEKTNTKVIATNDVHYIEESHDEAHDRLVCLSTGRDFNDPNRMRYTKQEWLKSIPQMQAIFADIPEVLTNTQEIVDKVEYYSILSPPLMPRFPIPEEFGTVEEYREKYTEEDMAAEFGTVYEKSGYEKTLRIKLEADYLKEIAYIGANERFPNGIEENYREQIDFELNIMKNMGFPGYFLIVQDFIKAGREMGVSIGPGRGSAAGSLVAYCLRITDIDPLKYGLLFERFLNPDRISLPDIDIDFDDAGRAQVLQWVTEKYGYEKVAQIATFGTMATKSSIKDVARVQGYPLAQSNHLAKLIPDKLPEINGKSPKITIDNCIKYVAELGELMQNDSGAAEVMKYASQLEGTVRQSGVHACGVIIGADDLTDLVPISVVKKDDTSVLVTQYEGNKIEDIGLIKMDFLGLKTLTIIKEAVKNIKLAKGIDIDIDNIPLDDPKTYQLFCKGDTIGVFQFESPGMQKYLRELQPAVFEDLIAMNALYRPGPMGYIPEFINRKHGRTPISYDLAPMEESLKETYGITVYQEQVMILSRILAGFTRGQSDELRKVMGKKIASKLPELKKKFMTGCEKNGHDPKICDKIWSDWESFASYAFNKSHATCYSWIAYQTAYLKAHHPAEYMAANLTSEKDNITSITKFMDECKSQGIGLLGPDVNESYINFTTNKKGEIRFGLGGIKGVGEAAADYIIQERNNGPYKNIFDFIERVNLNSCNKRTIESLIIAGAMDSFDMKREQYFAINSKGEVVIDSFIRYGSKFQTDQKQNTASLFGNLSMDVEIAKPEIVPAQEWSVLEKLNKERDLVGIYLSSHPLDKYGAALHYGTSHNMNQLGELLANAKSEINFTTGGMVVGTREGTTKTGNPYGSITIEDFSGTYEFMLFGKDYLEYKQYMTPNLNLLIKGAIKERGSDFKFKKEPDPNMPKVFNVRINKIELLDEVYQDLIKKITIHLPIQNIDHEIYELICSLETDFPKGNCKVYVTFIDIENGTQATLGSSKVSISIDEKLVRHLRQLSDSDRLTFKIN